MKEPILRTRILPAGRDGYKVARLLKVEGGLNHIKGNHAPHFTVTTWAHRKGFPEQCQSGGCDHETILKYWPELSDLVALHLSDIDGVPMHGEANGWYDLAGALPANAGEQYHRGNSEMNLPKPEGALRRGTWDDTDYRKPTPDECLEILARHVRVDFETARKLRDDVVGIWVATRRDCEQAPAATETETASDAPDFLTWTKSSWKAARAFFSEWIDQQRPRWKTEADACIAKHNLRVFGDPWPAAETGNEKPKPEGWAMPATANDELA
jgi:hypothetical protein